MRLKDKLIAITGAGGGIGQAAATLFAEQGAHVVILEIDETSGGHVAQTIGDRASFIQTDVSDHTSVKRAFDTIAEKFDRLDVLYNNASIFLGKQDGAVTDLTPQTWRRILSVNLDSIFYCCKYALPIMIRSGGGSVINTSSSAGIIGIPNCDAYTACKGATIALTRSMAVEYGPKSVRVNCIAPAAVYTPMVRQSNLNSPDFDEQKFLANAPLRRWGQPRDIANAALFLASDDSSYINGAVLVADGGITIT